ncbi:MAG: FHA domain containing protein [Clostridia bacterium 41_269]|nr:MAG: FHA domain containing protein [Clostridia bacterium 41_269]
MELALTLTVLRYTFLVLLYIFVFTVVRHMFKGTKEKPKTYMPQRQTAYMGSENFSVKTGTSSAPRLISLKPLPGNRNVFYLNGRTTIGSGRNNNIVIKSPYVSREHAVIFKRGDQYWLQDLDSKNGTYLNGFPVKNPTVLAHGDHLSFGGADFKFLKW